MFTKMKNPSYPICLLRCTDAPVLHSLIAFGLIFHPLMKGSELPLIEAYPPPSNKGKYIKIKYITQLPNTQVPSFVYFANLPQYVKDPYKRFLENKMREKWNLTGTPVNIYIRQK